MRGTCFRYLLVIALLVSIVVPGSGVTADTSSACQIQLFLSPYCRACQQRFVEAVPTFASLETLGGHIEFQMIALRGDRSEFVTLQHLVCANAQERFIPYFLFVSRAIREERNVHHTWLAHAIGLDMNAFYQCVHDTTYFDATLERSRATFDAFGLTGVPSVLVKDGAFTFRDMREVLEMCVSH
jgi:hypothetical protein